MSYGSKRIIALLILLVTYIILMIVLPNWLVSALLAGIAGWALGGIYFPMLVDCIFAMLNIKEEEKTE
jgi:hypothetical protein